MPRQRSSRKKSTSELKKLIVLLLAVTGLAIGLSNVQRISELLSRATAEPANITVDSQAILQPLPRPWRNLSQGGESQDWRMEPIANYVQALNPEYIRIDHIYDFYDVVSGEPGNLQFSFDKLDLIIDDILAAGATPYIALSYMPPAIASGDIVSAPQNYSDWSTVVQRTVEHISGTRAIPDVYYEVWNEPDLFGGWLYYGTKNYLDLYTASARGATQARVTQPFKLGGPATTGLYRNWVDALAEHALANNLRLDFISWHRYSTNIDDFRRDMVQIQTWLREYPQLANTELHITEWGHDSENNSGYDGMFAAAHTTAGAIEMSGVVERAFVFEIQDGKDPAGQQLWGRWGLLTHNDMGLRVKPRYRALELLEQMASQQLVLRGKGTYVKALASREIDGPITIALANYDRLARNSEVVPITITNLKPGKYEIKTTSLMSPPTATNLAVTDGTLVTSIPLRPLEVAMIEIKMSLDQ